MQTVGMASQSRKTVGPPCCAGEALSRRAAAARSSASGRLGLSLDWRPRGAAPLFAAGWTPSPAAAAVAAAASNLAARGREPACAGVLPGSLVGAGAARVPGPAGGNAGGRGGRWGWLRRLGCLAPPGGEVVG